MAQLPSWARAVQKQTPDKRTLEERIDEQDIWTFAECLGLAADYGTKVRMVIASVYARGKTYVERDLTNPQDSQNSI